MVAGPLDVRVRDRIVAETRGNPLALLELPHGRSPAELAGGFGLADEPTLPGRIEESFRQRLETLPPSTRLLLLIAAAEPVGDPVLVWRAAAALGIGGDAAAPATAAGLVDLDAHVRFRHPLVRSAAYGAAAPEERQRVHRALADATDAEADPDRRAWHRAQAIAGLDEDVAAELEHSAGRARARGGLAAGAAFHARAAELTPDPARRAQRALAAAQGKHQAGAPDAALRLLAMAQAGLLDDLEQARAQLLHAQITFTTTRGRDAPPLLLAAAKRLEPLDPTLARETYLDAFAAALSAERLARGGGAREVAAAVLAADWEPSTRRACDLLLDGLAQRHAEGCAAAAAALKRALRAFRDEPLAEDEELRWLWLACHVARHVADEVSWDELTARHLELARRTGAFSLLPVALEDRFGVELLSGNLAAATLLAAEQDAVIEATGSPLAGRAGIALAFWLGRDAEAQALTESRRRDVLRRGEGLWLTANDWGTAVRYNGLGRYDDALAALEEAAQDLDGPSLSMWVAAEFIEAAVRSGRPERAADPLARLAAIAEANGTDWALGVHAARAALLADGPAAERLYREAIERLARTRIRVAAARAHLLYGEWLRRENRRVDAREQLRAAHELFTEMGNEAFAERARRELLATGETVRRRSVETLDELTPQEAQIARLAAGGHTNPEIGAQLFLSPRTVEWHLRKVFGKLGISSRRELRSALPGARATVVAVLGTAHPVHAPPGSSRGTRRGRLSGWVTTSSDELLAAVDVVGRAGERGVAHEVHGERRDVLRADHAPDRQRVAELSPPLVEPLTEQRRRQSRVDEAGSDEVDPDGRELDRQVLHERRAGGRERPDEREPGTATAASRAADEQERPSRPHHAVGVTGDVHRQQQVAGRCPPGPPQSPSPPAARSTGRCPTA